ALPPIVEMPSTSLAEDATAELGAGAAVGAPKTTTGEIPWRERLAGRIQWITAVWMFGVALLSLRHFEGWRRVAALRRAGVIAPPEWQQGCAQLASRFGWRRP